MAMESCGVCQDRLRTHAWALCVERKKEQGCWPRTNSTRAVVRSRLRSTIAMPALVERTGHRRVRVQAADAETVVTSPVALQDGQYQRVLGHRGIREGRQPGQVQGVAMGLLEPAVACKSVTCVAKPARKLQHRPGRRVLTHPQRLASDSERRLPWGDRG